MNVHVFVVERRHKTRLMHEPIRNGLCDGKPVFFVSVTIVGHPHGVVIGLGVGAEGYAAEAGFASHAGAQDGCDGGGGFRLIVGGTRRGGRGGLP